MLIKEISITAASDRLKKFAIYKVAIKNLDREFLAEVAAEGHATLSDFLSLRFVAVESPIKELYSAALIAADADAYELSTCALLRDLHVVRLSLQGVFTPRRARHCRPRHRTLRQSRLR